MEHPNMDFFDHPVFIPHHLHLETAAMKKIADDLHQWLWTGTTGGVIIGASRVGKTTALQALTTKLYTRGGVAIPTYYVSMPPRDRMTIATVFRQLCYSNDLLVKQYDRADHLAERFINYIADRSTKMDCQQAVLFVDEMQRLWPAQFNAFAELYDKLLLLDIYLAVIFVGNDQECNQLFEEIEKPNYSHIHGRFFTQRASFRGLTSNVQVKTCLSQYDRLRYPADGPTYTGYFLPNDEKKGWRLSSLSSDIWRVFHDYQRSYHIDSWGMQYFTAAINMLLSDFLPRYGVKNFDDDMMHECIRISGLVPSLVQSSE